MKNSREEGFKVWEIALLILAMFVFLTSAYVYVNGISFRELISAGDGGLGEKVGILDEAFGETKRQLPAASAFEEVGLNADLYNGDTVVTGKGAKMLIRLDDGSTIEMGENTMMKIAFERKFTLTGITRVPSVQVLAGNVVGKSKSTPLIVRTQDRELSISQGESQKIATTTPAQTPTPTAPVASTPTPVPSPTLEAEERKLAVRLISPKHKSLLSVEDGAVVPEARVVLQWSSEAPSEPLELMVGKLEANGKFEPKFSRVILPNEEGQSEFPVRLRAPGTYRWQVSTPADRKSGFLVDPVPRADFSIKKEFRGIEVEGVDLDLRAQPPRMTVRWKTYNPIDEYRLVVSSDRKMSQKMIDEEIKGTSYSFDVEEVLGKSFFYRIFADHPSGFRVLSGMEEFKFTLKAPLLRNPENGSSVAAGQTQTVKGQKAKTIFFTWSRVPMGKAYLFEIGKDPKFVTTSAKRKTTDNFYAIKMLPPGSYYWRATTFSGSFSSQPSEVFQLIVTP